MTDDTTPTWGNGITLKRSGASVRPLSKAEALRSVLPAAWEEASAGLGFAPFRMMGYAARRLAEKRYGIPADEFTIAHNGDWGYALRTWEEQNPELAAKLNITRKPRGRGYEPHTGVRVDFGTVEVNEYVGDWCEPEFSNPQLVPPEASASVLTAGPDGLYQGVLLIEKDGLLEFIRRAKIAERHDLMVASTEGQSVEAVKKLIEQLTIRYGLPIYVLYDFDIAGVLSRAAIRGRDTKSWEWTVTPNVIDLGIHFDDIEPYDIADESVSGEDDWVPLLEELALEDEKITDEAIAYLVAEQWQAPSRRKNRRGKIVTHWRGRRAELNGLIGQTFIDFIEEKLKAAKVKKLIPDDELLADTYRHGIEIQELNRRIEKLVDAFFQEERDEVQVPDDLREQVEQALRDNREQSWDLALLGLLPQVGNDEGAPAA